MNVFFIIIIIVKMRSVIINNHKFNQFINKKDDIDTVSKIPRSFKSVNKQLTDYKQKLEKNKRDSKYSFKNQRITNKDWKDFNNSNVDV